MISPIIYLFTGIPPVSAWSTPFYLHFLPFFIFSELAFMFGTWGISAWDGRASYLSFFSMNLRALNTVLRGEQIKFHVTLDFGRLARQLQALESEAHTLEGQQLAALNQQLQKESVRLMAWLNARGVNA